MFSSLGGTFQSVRGWEILSLNPGKEVGFPGRALAMDPALPLTGYVQWAD
jgi:hypothetical protein